MADPEANLANNIASVQSAIYIAKYIYTYTYRCLNLVVGKEGRDSIATQTCSSNIYIRGTMSATCIWVFNAYIYNYCWHAWCLVCVLHVCVRVIYI